MDTWKIYKENASRFNWMFFIFFVALHFIDFSFTYMGVGYLGYGEANCAVKEEVEQGNFIPFLLQKIFVVTSIGFLVFFGLVNPFTSLTTFTFAFNGMLSIILILLNLILLFATIQWAFFILIAFL